jgi:hypothetical protein
MHGQLGGVKNVPRILSALKAGKANLANWQGLVKVSELEAGVPYHHITNDPDLKVHFPHCDTSGQAQGTQHGRRRRYRQKGT